MEAAIPVLSPRQELFCRYAALGHTLAEAARRAGYSPSSACQRGSELYARKQIQDRVAEIRGYCKHYQQYGTALRALTAEIRLSGVNSRRAERRTEKDEERETELRASIEAELRERIARIEAEAYERARADLAAEMAAEPVLSGTFHDISGEPDGPTMTNHDFPGLFHVMYPARGGSRTACPGTHIRRAPARSPAPRSRSVRRMMVLVKEGRGSQTDVERTEPGRSASERSGGPFGRPAGHGRLRTFTPAGTGAGRHDPPRDVPHDASDPLLPLRPATAW